MADKTVVKICDFGMAKNVQQDNNYVKKGDGPLPIKWMAIESIGDRIFTIKSDVWSFGVLLWEIFTLGANPYPGIEANAKFYEELKNGYRMNKPELCPITVYMMMKDCWEADPDKRPNFTRLAGRLGSLIEDSVRDYYLQLNTPYDEKNKQFLEEDNYLQMAGTEEHFDYANMNAIIAPPNDPYDAINNISKNLRPAMEIVPMIHFDSDDKGPEDENYLSMSTQSDNNQPPNHDLVNGQNNYANLSAGATYKV